MATEVIKSGVRATSVIVTIDGVLAQDLIFTLGVDIHARIKKIMLMNNTGANDLVTFGEVIAAVWTPRLPAIYILTPFDEQLDEWSIPAFEFTSNIFARSATAGVGTTEDVCIEVELIG